MKDLQVYRRFERRRYSYDDFFLIDNTFQRNTIFSNYNENFYATSIQYLVGEEYEMVRKLTRVNMVKQKILSQYKLVHF
jgi:hypothetical protein